MFLKIIKSYREIVALCDKEILGKTFEEGNFQLDIKESFYKGKEVNEEEAIEILKDMAMEDATFNIAGEKSVKTAIKAGIIQKNSVGKIAGIPFALVLI
jgi:hypothetical protein